MSSPKHFIHEIIDADLASGARERIHTRFPPEPNGYLHIGHAKSICLNFGLAAEYQGLCNLRFDDTNPSKEEVEYVESIKEDIRWLGFDWEDRLYFASDYFEQLYTYAEQLIKTGDAFVCDLKDDQISEYRGNYYREGKPSPWRERSVEENLDLFRRMRAGEFEDGSRVLRGKIEINSPNMNMRDPILYRIRRVHHHRTGDDWCIYPMYDFAHGLSDAIEGISHSLCTLEFEDHRPLYDWSIEALGLAPRPHQTEFARFNLSYTVMSKRKLLQLVEEGKVSGWDDPRMPTLAGLRRRGVSPSAIRKIMDETSVGKREGVVDVALFESILRDDLNESAPRAMAVLKPLKVVIENFAEDRVEWFEAPRHPSRPKMGSRPLALTRELYVERDDYRDEAPRKWHRLAPGKEVRLRYACLITLKEVIRDEAGEAIELRCIWDPDSLGGDAPDGRKVRGTLHWVSAAQGIPVEARLYDRLFKREDPYQVEEGQSWLDNINPNSIEICQGFCEPSLREEATSGSRWQFERLGYFAVDPDSEGERLIFNRSVTLRDSWARIERAMKRQQAEAERRKKKGKKSSRR